MAVQEALALYPESQRVVPVGAQDLACPQPCESVEHIEWEESPGTGDLY